MRTTSLLTRRGLTVAAAATLPLSLAAPAAVAAGVDVSASGSTVTATTAGCRNGGNAALLASGQADYAEGRQTALGSGRATWTGVGAGTYQVVVVCSDGTTMGPMPVTVRAAPATAPASTPIGGVRGGLGGTVRDFGPRMLAAGGTLVAAAVLAGAWYVRRRAPGRHV